MKKYYRVRKATIELKKGAILEEKDSDEGTLGYGCINTAAYRFHDDQRFCSYSPKTVQENPQFFEEVFSVWLSAEEMLKLKKTLPL